MELVVKKGEFAKMLGLHPAYVDQYIKHNKIVTLADDKKMVDITHPANVAFMKHIKEKQKQKEGQPEIKKDNTPVHLKRPEKPKRNKPETTKDYTSTDPSESDDGIYNINQQKAKADLDKKLIEIERIKLINAKLRGQSVPTAMVKNLISTLSNTFISSYKESADKLLIEISHRKKLSLNESAEMKGELVKIINSAHDLAIDGALANLETILSLGPEMQNLEDE